MLLDHLEVARDDRLLTIWRRFILVAVVIAIAVLLVAALYAASRLGVPYDPLAPYTIT
jgi:hypothetical protein